MSNGRDDEEEIEEMDEDLDDEDFGPDDDEPIGFDEFDDDDDFEDLDDDEADVGGGGGGGGAGNLDTSEANKEEALKANPKRLTAAQRKKASALIEGIIDTAELTHQEGLERAWAKLNEKIGDEHARKYDIKAEFTENDVIDHPKFGIGYVVELVHPTKIEVLFEDGLKKMVCNLS